MKKFKNALKNALAVVIPALIMLIVSITAFKIIIDLPLRPQKLERRTVANVVVKSTINEKSMIELNI